MFRLPKEPSVRGIMYSSYTLGVILSVLAIYEVNLLSLLGTTLSFITFLLQLMLYSYVNERLKQKRYTDLIRSLSIFLPLYLYVITLVNMFLGVLLLTLKIILLFFIGIPYRRDVNNIVSYLVGTILITTVYLEPPVFLGATTIEIYIVWVLIATYFTSTSYYIESKLAFRDVKPIYPFLSWIWIIPFTYLLHPNPFILIATVEPTIKHIMNICRNVKVSKGVDIIKMGRLEMKRGYLFVILIIISIALEKFI